MKKVIINVAFVAEIPDDVLDVEDIALDIPNFKDINVISVSNPQVYTKSKIVQYTTVNAEED